MANEVTFFVWRLFRAKIVEGFLFCCGVWLSQWVPSPTASRVTRDVRAVRVCRCGCPLCLRNPPGGGACVYLACCRCSITRILRWWFVLVQESECEEGVKGAKALFHNPYLPSWRTWCGAGR